MTTLESGSTFGPYTIEGFIAGGGMGKVYAAKHSVYGHPVALKILHAKLHEDPSWRLRFNEEGLVGTQLKHPGVLSARELVEHDGQVALVLDLIGGGQTLLKVVEREFPDGLPAINALQVLLSMVAGIEYLHDKGVVHGDIKPENVLIVGDFREPETWAPMVTDFGTVALIAHPVTIAGRAAVVATPRYASPEHLYGVDHIVEASDVYGLGLLLHFMLTGRHASVASTVQEAAEVVVQPIPIFNLIDQPEAVLALVRRAAHPDIDERYSSCRELALGVREVLDGLGVRLDMEDLRADLATEIMEDQAKAQRETHQSASAGSAREAYPDEVDTEIVPSSELQPVDEDAEVAEVDTDEADDADEADDVGEADLVDEVDEADDADEADLVDEVDDGAEADDADVALTSEALLEDPAPVEDPAPTAPAVPVDGDDDSDDDDAIDEADLPTDPPSSASDPAINARARLNAQRAAYEAKLAAEPEPKPRPIVPIVVGVVFVLAAAAAIAWFALV